MSITLWRGRAASRATWPESIFVQIASYRDPQLPLTIADCLAKAARPERLVFGICWQRDPSERLDEYIHDRRFRVITIPYQESRGVCWARHQIQRLYDGEEYTLQLDSHHRFTRHWDEKCVKMVKRLHEHDIALPLLTAYAPSFNPTNDPVERTREVWTIRFDGFTPGGSVSLRPAPIPADHWLAEPLSARFYSGHFAFTLGRFCVDVPHDPALYFHGEEISIAVRAFTHGYDLFHPHIIILWHEYAREGRRKHWEDHGDWHLADTRSHERLRALLGIESPVEEEHFGRFGLGSVRALRDYERYAGICFKQRGVERYTLDDRPPPNPAEATREDKWLHAFCRLRSYTVRLTLDELPTSEDCNFWFIGAHDASGREIHRQDIGQEEISRIDRSREWVKTVEFLSDTVPESWTVWPHSTSKGWQQKITKPV